jgi:hypothetical protein
MDVAVLEKCYHEELRPYLANAERQDLTLRLWIEMLRDPEPRSESQPQP